MEELNTKSLMVSCMSCFTRELSSLAAWFGVWRRAFFSRCEGLTCSKEIEDEVFMWEAKSLEST